MITDVAKQYRTQLQNAPVSPQTRTLGDSYLGEVQKQATLPEARFLRASREIARKDDVSDVEALTILRGSLAAVAGALAPGLTMPALQTYVEAAAHSMRAMQNRLHTLQAPRPAAPDAWHQDAVRAEQELDARLARQVQQMHDTTLDNALLLFGALDANGAA